jgi:MFS family permease
LRGPSSFPSSEVVGYRSFMIAWVGRLLRAEPQARRFFLAYAQSALGTGAAYVALVLIAYERLHSPWAIALVLLADYLPPMLLAPLFGAAADRWSRKYCAVLADAARAIAFIGIALVHGIVPTVAFALLGGTGTALFKPAIMAALPSLVRRDRLPEATSLYGALTEVGYTLGPAIAALVLLVSGPGPLLAANGVTFAISAALLSSLKFGGHGSNGDTRPIDRASLLREARDGIGVVMRIPVVRTVIFATSAMIFTAGIINVSELILVNRFHGGHVGYAILVTVSSIGIGIGSFVGKSGGELPALERRYLMGISLFAFGLLCASASPVLAGVVIAFGVGGIGNGVVIVYQRMILQNVVSDSLLGRVFGMQAASDGAAFAAAFVFTGGILSVVSPRPLFAVAGAGSAVVAVVALRSLRSHPPLPEQPAAEQPRQAPQPDPLALSGPDLGR